MDAAPSQEVLILELALNLEKAAELFGVDENHAVAGAFIVMGCLAIFCGLWSLREAYLARRSILLTGAIRGTVLSSVTPANYSTRTFLVVDVELPDGERKTVQGRSDMGAKLHVIGQPIPVQYHATSGRLVVLDNPTVQQRIRSRAIWWLLGGVTVTATGIAAILLAGPIKG